MRKRNEKEEKIKMTWINEGRNILDFYDLPIAAHS